MGRPKRSIAFVTRQGCTICAKARETLSTPARLLRVSIQEVDVDADPALLERFGGRVPVLLGGDGTVLSEGALTFGDAWRASWNARSPGASE